MHTHITHNSKKEVRWRRLRSSPNQMLTSQKPYEMIWMSVSLRESFGEAR